jgi:hypothetical protein
MKTIIESNRLVVICFQLQLIEANKVKKVSPIQEAVFSPRDVGTFIVEARQKTEQDGITRIVREIRVSEEFTISAEKEC